MRDVLKHLDCMLVIAGEFYEAKEEYMTLITELELDDHTVVVDQYISNEDVSLYFCSADVVVLPYIDATQSGIIQIAFGLNKPVITTRVGGLPEVVEHGKTGLLVEKESSQALAQAIIQYYTDNLEEPFSKAIANTSSQFEWDVELDNIFSFITDQSDSL